MHITTATAAASGKQREAKWQLQEPAGWQRRPRRPERYDYPYNRALGNAAEARQVRQRTYRVRKSRANINLIYVL